MTRQHIHLALHLWWRYTWRACVFSFLVGLPAGGILAFEIMMWDVLPKAVIVAGFVLTIATALALEILVVVRIVRSPAFLKPFQSDGLVLHPIILVNGQPTNPAPWASAFGILWGVGWRAWCFGCVANLALRGAMTTATHSATYLLATLVAGQIATILGFAWVIAKPLGRTRLDVAADGRSIMQSPRRTPRALWG